MGFYPLCAQPACRAMATTKVSDDVDMCDLHALFERGKRAPVAETVKPVAEKQLVAETAKPVEAEIVETRMKRDVRRKRTIADELDEAATEMPRPRPARKVAKVVEATPLDLDSVDLAVSDDVNVDSLELVAVDMTAGELETALNADFGPNGLRPVAA
jgi:hypothetical protein